MLSDEPKILNMIINSIVCKTQMIPWFNPDTAFITIFEAT